MVEMATSCKRQFGLALMNLYRNAPKSVDISLTIDFTKGTVLSGDEVIMDKRSGDATSHLPPTEKTKSMSKRSTRSKKSSKSSRSTKSKSSKSTRKTQSTKKTQSKSGKKKRKTLRKKATTDDEVDWNEPLEGIVLPDGDYSTFDEIELLARRIQTAARKKNIPIEKEIAYRNSQPKTGPVNSLRRRMDILVMPVHSPTTGNASHSSLYEMYYPVKSASKKKKSTTASKKKKKSSRPLRAKSGKKKNRRDSTSDDLKLCNSKGKTATSFDIDSISLRTDDIFQ